MGSAGQIWPAGQGLRDAALKQAKITLNLFHFSRHRVPFIQDETNGGMRSRPRVVELILLLIFHLLLPYCQMKI